MIAFRLFTVIFKLTVCLSFKRYFIVRLIFLPIHITLYPHLFFLQYHRRLQIIMESLGIVFIKIGQSLSLKSFLFSKETLKALSYLQENVKPVKIDVNQYLTKYNPKLYEFKGFSVNPIPIASASVAQVYKGKLNDQDIAIKIVKPNIKQYIEKDFAVVFFLVKIANLFCSPALQIVDVANDIHTNILNEINLTNEVENLQEVKRNIIFDTGTYTPSVFFEYCNQNVMVMSYINGTSLRNVIHGTHSYNTKVIAENIIKAYLCQVYRDGLFHADMHAGNIFVNKNNSITLLDFGLVSRISLKDRRAVATMIYAFLHNNYELVLKTQLEAGYILEKIFFNEQYRLAMQKLSLNFQGNFEMSLFTRELFSIMNKFNVFVPKHLLMLNKTIMYVEDVTKQLDPNFQPFKIILPWIKKWYCKEQITICAEKLFKLLK